MVWKLQKFKVDVSKISWEKANYCKKQVQKGNSCMRLEMTNKRVKTKVPLSTLSTQKYLNYPKVPKNTKSTSKYPKVPQSTLQYLKNT